MFESLLFIAGFFFGASSTWFYCSKVHNLIKKMDVLHSDLADTIQAWRKDLNSSQLRSS